MNLSDLIKKGSLRDSATATPATPATHETQSPPSVATVATVAVAKAPEDAQKETAVVPDRWCWPHSTAMNSEEIDSFNSRVSLFLERGLGQEEASSLADRLVIRDRDEDDRSVCLECAYLQRFGRCGNWRKAGVAIASKDAQLPQEFTVLLQRCDGFAKGTSLIFEGFL